MRPEPQTAASAIASQGVTVLPSVCALCGAATRYFQVNLEETVLLCTNKEVHIIIPTSAALLCSLHQK